MGVLWTLESLQHYAGAGAASPSLRAAFLAVDCLNVSRGAFLFLVFVCKRSVLKALRGVTAERSCGLLGCGGREAAGSGTTVTNTTASSGEEKCPEAV